MKNFKNHPILKILNTTFIDMPSPSSINFNWNYGSLLGVFMVIQVMTGILLSFHYTPFIEEAFSSLILSTRNIHNLWLIRWLHANGASLLFFFLYLHIGRNMYMSSFKNSETWTTGMSIFLLMMMTAFMGYVLPWGQMSFWGVTVITNLLSSIPYIGQDIVSWLWGGFSVSNSTLKRFFTLHFILPFIILFFILLHLMFLHQHGSSNPIGTQNNNDMLFFHPFFSIKDLVGFLITLTIFILITLVNPTLLNDPENFIQANSMITPIHIQPEWYFLFAYAILRSVPNKLGGVLALVMSILIFFLLPMMKPGKIPLKFNIKKKMIFWNFLSTFFILTWIGMCPIDPPFTFIGITFSLLYFVLFLFMFML